MSEEDTLIIPPKLTEITNDPLLAAILRVALAQLFIVGLFCGALLFALGVLVGVVV